jgi:cytochrome c peroxidase
MDSSSPVLFLLRRATFAALIGVALCIAAFAVFGGSASVAQETTRTPDTPAAATPAYFGAIYAPVPGRPQPSAAQLAALGKRIFFDPSLSASGRQSCASCHDPKHAYGPPNARSVQLGGADGLAQGQRAAPSLRYLQTLGAFTEHYHDNDGDDSIDAGPTGGRMWDGRAGSAHEQAGMPLLAPLEMGNDSIDAVARKLEQADYAGTMRAVFGDGLFRDSAEVFRAAGLALETFQESPADFYPFTSKYDAVLRGQQKLSVTEARGLKVFEDPEKGNCAACHISQRKADGSFPLFTDFGLIALGVPRNRTLAANADPAYHDLGLCGPIRTDLADKPDYCGLFRTPTLRNVAVKRAFFHNGVFHSLEEVVRFYAQRDTTPQRWYAKGPDGKTKVFDDLPPQYHANVNVEQPFGQERGDKPALTEAEIRDVVAFLGTLTDEDQQATCRPSPAKRPC